MSNYLIPVIFVTSIIGIATIVFFNSKSTSVYNPNPSALQSEINDSTRNSIVDDIPRNIFSEKYDDVSEHDDKSEPPSNGLGGGAKSKKYKKRKSTKSKKSKKNKSTKRKNK
jgi:hypothetical protein